MVVNSGLTFFRDGSISRLVTSFLRVQRDDFDSRTAICRWRFASRDVTVRLVHRRHHLLCLRCVDHRPVLNRSNGSSKRLFHSKDKIQNTNILLLIAELFWYQGIVLCEFVTERTIQFYTLTQIAFAVRNFDSSRQILLLTTFYSLSINLELRSSSISKKPSFHINKQFFSILHSLERDSWINSKAQRSVTNVSYMLCKKLWQVSLPKRDPGSIS